MSSGAFWAVSKGGAWAEAQRGPFHMLALRWQERKLSASVVLITDFHLAALVDASRADDADHRSIIEGG